MLSTHHEKNTNHSTDCHVDNKSEESVNQISITSDSLDNDNDHIKCPIDQYFNAVHIYSNEYFINLTCSLRSLLVKMYIKSNRFQ
ncbi:unnamed protein product, partial [Schistosoma turkestanicum]